MPKRNAELLLRAIEAFNARDLEAFVALADEDVEIHSRIVAMEGGYRGRARVRRWWQDLLEFIPDYRLELQGEIREIGDMTLAKLRARGHGATSDAPLDETIWHVGRWREEKICWWQIFTSEAEALEAAGS